MMPSILKPTWRPGRLLPRFTDEELLTLVNRPDTDLRPWAAFSLGYRSRGIGVTLAFLTELPDFIKHSFKAIPMAVNNLNLACDVLADTIPLGVMDQIRHAAARLEGWNDSAVEAHAAGRQVSRPTAVEIESAERLPVLTNLCLGTSHPLRSWYDVGRELADARPPSMGPVVLSPRDHLVHLLKGIRQLPSNHAVRWGTRQQADASPRWPLLHLLAELAESTQQNETALRHRFLAYNDGYSDDRLGRARLYAQLSLVAEEVETYLKEASKPCPIPFWELATGKLYFDSEEIMFLNTERASAIALILNRFQDLAWREEGIDDPNGCAEKTKKGHIRTLNESLKVPRIRFGGGGTRLRIRWFPV